jgi:tetratricopeptide (TPR) repeat protein
LELAEQAVTGAEGSGDDRMLLKVLVHVIEPLRVPSHIHLALDRTKRAVDLSTAVGDLNLSFWAHINRHIVSTCTGEMTESQQSLETARNLAKQLSQPISTCVALFCSAATSLLRGDIAEAAKFATEAQTVASLGDEAQTAALFSVPFASASWQQGNLGVLLSVIEFMATSNPEFATLTGVLAVAHLQAGNTAHSLRFLEDFRARDFTLPMNSGWTIGMAAYAEIATETRQPRYCEPIYELLEPSAHLISYNGICTEGPLCMYLGGLAASLGRFDEAEGYFDQSLAICKRIGAKSFEARTMCMWGYMLFQRDHLRYKERSLALATEANRIANVGDYLATRSKSEALIALLR